MTQENPKQPVRNLERVTEKKFKTYDAATNHKAAVISACASGSMPDKVKIFARNDNTFDVVVYRKIVNVKVVDVVIATDGNSVTVAKVHGQKSKDRKKPFVPKKFA